MKATRKTIEAKMEKARDDLKKCEVKHNKLQKSLQMVKSEMCRAYREFCLADDEMKKLNQLNIKSNLTYRHSNYQFV